MIINKFTGLYTYLSNFSFYRFVDETGIMWQTTEHYFQAMKIDPNHPNYQEWFNLINKCNTPFEAKQYGRKCPMRSDWDDIKVTFMYKALKFKFSQNPKILNQLIETGDSLLIEGNNWGDRYWGKVNGIGENMLGKLLMIIREELKNTSWIYR